MLSDSVSWWNHVLTLQERGLALKQMTDMQPCSKVLMQGRLFSHGDTSLFCSLELHPLNCKRTHANSVKETTHRLNILHVMPSSGCCMLRPHPVKSRTSQCTSVQRYVTVGRVHKCNRPHLTTPNCRCWVWSVVQQTWTFQPIEVSATILTPYMI